MPGCRLRGKTRRAGHDPEPVGEVDRNLDPIADDIGGRGPTDARGRPNGTILATEVVPGRNLASPPASGRQSLHYNLVEFRPSPVVEQGVSYAYTLDTEQGDCDIWLGPPGDTYTEGKGFYQTAGNPPGWLALFAPERDLAFQVFVQDQSLDD